MRALSVPLAAVLFFSAQAADEKLPRGVKHAVKQGRKWLRQDLLQVLKPGKDPQEGPRRLVRGPDDGHVFLSGLALLHAGLPKDDPVFGKVWDRIEAFDASKTYETGLALMWCEGMLNKPGAGGPPHDRVRAWVRKAVDRMVEGGKGGVWSYASAGYGKGGKEGNGDEVSSNGEARVGTEAMRAVLKKLPAAPGDLSNTQYAVLGLKAAALCGVRPDGADFLWRVVAQRWIDGQQQEGPPALLSYGRQRARARGWGYYSPTFARHSTGSMTCAGLAILAIARSEIRNLAPEEDKAIRESIRDGAAWLGRYFSVQSNPDGKEEKDRPKVAYKTPWHYYYLYGLERAGILTGLSSFDQYDWYVLGCRHLVGAQAGDGSWSLPEGGIAFVEDATTRTCFALLFLARATSQRYARPYEALDIGEERKPEPEAAEAALGELPEPDVRPLEAPAGH